MVGTRLSHYLVEEEIGQGGMGVVYKAQDSRLFRFVAIKILPPHLVSDEKTRQRFVQEARAASALNHPNICTVHDIGEADGAHFIVMELVEGRTLRQVLEERGPLPEPEVIEIGVKVCEALAAAHAKGIVHRDIKPDNIMLTERGLVKVMDFGLAKLMTDEMPLGSAGDSSGSFHSTANIRTTFSTLQGTASYMSPEQIRKESVDHRSDIFSLGAVFYELLTGRLPFQANTSTEILTKIIREEPTPISEPISGELVRLVYQMLGKALDKRIQNIPEVGRALNLIAKHQSFSKRQSLTSRWLKRSLPRGKMWAAMLGFGLIVAGIIVYMLLSPDAPSDRGTAQTTRRTSPMVTSPYYDDYPTISPAGERLAYVSDKSGNLDIWVHELDGSKTRNLTENFLGEDTEPAWSPDGTQLVFRSARNGGGIYMTSLNGNHVQQISAFGELPSWSPVGNRIAFVSTVDENGENAIWQITVNDLEPSKILDKVDGYFYTTPRWSADGNWLVFGFEAGSEREIHAVFLTTRKPYELLSGRHKYVRPVISSDMKSLYFMSNAGGIADIWRVAVSFSSQEARILSDPHAKTTGIGMRFFSMTGDARTLVYSKGVRTHVTEVATRYKGGLSSMLLMSIGSDQVFGFSTARRLDFDGQSDPEFSPDGKWIAFESRRSGKNQIWTVSVDGIKLNQVTDDDRTNAGPSWSPDGGWLAYDSGGGNDAEIRMIAVEGGKPIPLTNNTSADWMPHWSPDGKSLIYSSNRSGNWDIWQMHLETRAEEQLTKDAAMDFGGKWSPDGDQIAFVSSRSGSKNIWLRSSSQAELQQLTHFEEEGGTGSFGWAPTGVGRTVSWAPDGTKIYFYRAMNSVFNVYAYDLHKRKIDQLTFYTHPSRHVTDFGGLSVKNSMIVFNELDRKSDIWVMENFDPQN